MLIELFLLRVTAEALWVNIGSKSAISLQRGAGWPKILGRSGRPTNHSSSQKTRLDDLSYGIKYGQIFLSFCHYARAWQTDRRTDSFLLNRPPCIQYSAVNSEAHCHLTPNLRDTYYCSPGIIWRAKVTL